MDTIVIYDISDNSLRARVARTLLEHGLVRIQKSAFYGFMNHNSREKLRMRLERMMDGEEGNIQLYPLCSRCFSLRESIGEIYEIEEEDVAVL
ncbi:MAG: CRISPR-associated endonuclease Cas2 [Methanothrix sp.]|nr:CRISPR-associated endonuclease Cas2 [Methanothrix sp.]